MTFKTHADLVLALKNIPWLVRCEVGHTLYSMKCNKIRRHELPEALRFVCNHPTEKVPSSSEATLAAFKSIVDAMGFDTQAVWKSSQSAYDAKVATHIGFWVLPRGADPASLVALIDRLHRKHTFFGGLIDVHGPNLPQLARCPDCHLLGHSSASCPLFGGTAVRLLFKVPIAAFRFEVLLEVAPSMRTAMLGNTHSRDRWSPSHKATLFFDARESSVEEMHTFQRDLAALVARAGPLLALPPLKCP